MDLMRLGIQSRKTGIKPKENLAKDKHDMEDIDEFFSESSWVAPTSDRTNIAQEFNIKKRRNLGPGRQRLPKPDNYNRVSTKISDASQKPLDSLDESKRGFKAPSSPRQVEAGLEYMESYDNVGLDYLDDDETNMSDTLTSPSAPVDTRVECLSPTNELSHRLQNLSSDRKSKASYSRLTKTMALNHASKVKGSGIRQGISGASFTQPSPGIAPASPREKSQDSVTDSQSQHDFHMSQGSHNVSGSLPSPPPEGLRRSKRTKIAPLAYWRNEKIVYNRVRENTESPDGTLVRNIRKAPLQEIAEVIHVPENSQKEFKMKSKHRTRARVAANKINNKEGVFDYESDPEIEGSEWFKQKSLATEIFDYNEEQTSRIVAWAPNGGDFQSPISHEEGSQAAENFRVASLFDMDSDDLAAGLLDFPIEGFKSLRSAGNSSFIFHVAKGMIEVTLNAKIFVVTRGCSFEIPKYNVYSFKNLGHGSARLFFVQCQVSSQ